MLVAKKLRKTDVQLIMKKRNKLTTVFLGGLILVLISYCLIDFKLSFWGRSELPAWKSLPFGIYIEKPNNYYSNLCFRDNDGFSLLCENSELSTSREDIYISKFIGYHIFKKELLIISADSLHNKYVISVKAEKQSGHNFLFDISILDNKPEIKSDHYINLKGKEALCDNLVTIRFILKVLFFFILILLIFTYKNR
jgi:hypothetical protein